MKLGGDVLGAWIEDEGNAGGVMGGEANEDALSGFAVPFGDRLVVLKLWVKHVDWASEYMSTGER